jgi:putative SOS response-associated peptidase YedK
MCGRFALHSSPEVVALQFGLAALPPVAPRYNVAPGGPVLVVRAGPDGAPQAVEMRWGLVPHWARDPAIGARLINARAESLAVKPAFRDAYRARRCLVPASGFYEWKSERGRRHPYYVHPAQGELFAFAALWERWRDLETCCIVTTESNRALRAVHDRMPVILASGDYAHWLERRTAADPGELLRPCPPEAIGLRRVGRAVNDARNESPRLIEPAEA